MKKRVTCTRPKYVCGNERLKLIGTTDGLFPDFGHHLEGEMGGLWMYPVKILDGFWMRLRDPKAETVDCFLTADEFENYPHKNVFYYGSGMGHTPVLVSRTQLIPERVNGLIATYEFKLPANALEPRTLELDYILRSNLRPDWLAEQKGIYDGSRDIAQWEETERAFLIRDCDHPWFAMAGCDFRFDSFEIGNVYGNDLVRGNGTGILISTELILKPGESKKLTFYTAASISSREECIRTYRELICGQNFEQEKKEKYQQLFNRTKLSVGDAGFEEIFDWIKVHTDWLTLKVEGIGRGITAGIPEYCWWFGCDSCYALQGIMLQGNYEVCRDTIKLILQHSRELNGNGRIIHELLPNGVSPNLGNCQETAHFIYLLWEYYLWTKDRSILEEAFDYVEKGIEWLLLQDEDQDYFPTGYGIIEIAGLNMEMIDSAVYMAEAVSCYVKMAEVLGKEIDKTKWETYADSARKAINTKFWSDSDGCYCDCHASAATINRKKEMILAQMKEANNQEKMHQFEGLLEQRLKKEDEEYGWLLNENWVINTPMETGIAPAEQAKRALERMHTPEFIGPYGMYLEGLRHKHTMTISTGVMAVAQARYGYSDRALELIERMFQSFSMATPGSISEMSPDYGCFTQAWTAYGVFVPVVRYFFGIWPDSKTNQIIIKPALPGKWKNAGLERVRVLDGEISIYIHSNKIKVVNHTSAEIVIKGDFAEKNIEE